MPSGVSIEITDEAIEDMVKEVGIGLRKDDHLTIKTDFLAAMHRYVRTALYKAVDNVRINRELARAKSNFERWSIIIRNMEM